MKTRSVALVSVLSVLLLSFGSSVSAEDRDRTPSTITAAFGAGLNTAQPGHEENHHILPQEFTVKITKQRQLDGTLVFVPATVNFIVNGFHWIWAYNPGVTVKEVEENAGDGLFVAYDTKIFAKGVFPGTPPNFEDAPRNPIGTLNRSESIGFTLPGRYLVICAVTEHFLDGMYAWVNVVDGNDNDPDDRDHDRDHSRH